MRNGGIIESSASRPDIALATARHYDLEEVFISADWFDGEAEVGDTVNVRGSRWLVTACCSLNGLPSYRLVPKRQPEPLPVEWTR